MAAVRLAAGRRLRTQVWEVNKRRDFCKLFFKKWMLLPFENKERENSLKKAGNQA